MAETQVRAQAGAQAGEQAGPERVGFVGFGEAARAFLSGWGAARPAHVAAFDIKTDRADTAPAMRAAYGDHGVDGRPDIAAALDGAAVVLCLVTADQAPVAAAAAGPHLRAGQWWFDGNSCAPQTKARAAEAIAAGGGRYVDMAIMAPVHPLKTRVPILLSGPDSAEATEVLAALGFAPQRVGDRVGQASAIKMLRSVMVKGMEALTAECVLAARGLGVEPFVLASLQASSGQIDWTARSSHNLERMMVHGTRRAAEMREVAAMLEGYGLRHAMTDASADWQTVLGGLGLSGGPDDLGDRADRARAALAAASGAGTAPGQGPAGD